MKARHEPPLLVEDELHASYSCAIPPQSDGERHEIRPRYVCVKQCIRTTAVRASHMAESSHRLGGVRPICELGVLQFDFRTWIGVAAQSDLPRKHHGCGNSGPRCYSVGLVIAGAMYTSCFLSTATNSAI